MKKLPKIIAFYGPRGAGKTFLCTSLWFAANKQHIVNKTLSFADPLKEMWDTLADGCYSYRTSQKKEEVHPVIGMSYRNFACEVGEQMRLLSGGRVFRDLMRERIERERGRYGLILIDDLRYHNEWRMLEEMGASFVQVLQPSAEAKMDYSADSEKDRPEFPDPDCVFDNSEFPNILTNHEPLQPILNLRKK